MEMSPKAIAAVTFPVVRKGYDPEQVRSFLSQLSRGVEELQNRALQAEAKARLSAAPAPAAEPAPNMDWPCPRASFSYVLLTEDAGARRAPYPSC